MKNFPDLNEMNDKILEIKQLLIELEKYSNLFPTLSRNSKRALASIKMLELNISDMVTFGLTNS